MVRPPTAARPTESSQIVDDNGSPGLRQRVPLAGPEADAVAERGAGQPVVAMPHDLVSRIRVMLAVTVSPEMRDQPHGVAEAVRRRHVLLPGIVAQEVEFVIGEHQFGLAVRDLAAEQRHHHDAPGDDGVDRDGALQPAGGAEQQELRPAAQFEDTEQIPQRILYFRIFRRRPGYVDLDTLTTVRSSRS